MAEGKIWCVSFSVTAIIVSVLGFTIVGWSPPSNFWCVFCAGLLVGCLLPAGRKPKEVG